MSNIRPRNTVLLFKAQAGELAPGDAFPTLSASADAVPVENPRFGGGIRSEQTNETSPSLDPQDPIVLGAPVTVSFDVYLKGSTAAGTAPRWANRLLPPCGLKETVTAAAVPVAAEACVADNSTDIVAELGAGASATAQLYRGMPILFSGDLTYATFISDYAAGKLATLAEQMSEAIDVDVDYQIPANVLYKPTSLESEMPFAACEFYKDGRLYQIKNMRGAVQIALQAGGTAKLSFVMTGVLHARSDAAVPAAVYGDLAANKLVWRGGKMIVNRQRVAVSQLSIDLGNAVESPPDPNAEDGFGAAFIGARRMMATLDPNMTLTATRDYFAAAKAGSAHILLAALGSVAGNRCAIVGPRGIVMDAPEGERNSLATEQVQMFLSGNDAGATICFW